MSPIRSLIVAPLVALAGATLAWAAPAPTCQASFEPLMSLEMAWGPKEALRQKRLFDESLEAIKPGAPNKRDVFILSAALGGEHVFDQEADGAAKALAAQYGGVTRVITLSNAAAALGVARPAATPDHFSAALARIGEAMEPEDVFILFITSHGQRGKGAAIYESQRLQAYLTPNRLAAELNDAGVKNRVLIISACFSGYYIPALQNDDTAILTAANAERSSFGCQPERDWTYFGDALFAHALAKNVTLLQGFEQAKTLIQQWESEQGMTPSQPSMAVGPNAAKFLADLERRNGR